jgi:hypothetical protein
MGSFQEKLSAAILSRIRKKQVSSAGRDRSQGQPPSKVPPAKLREATFADFEGTSRLKNRCGIVADSPENWHRLWKANPALVAGAPPRPIGWVLEAEGEIVGYLGNISLQCQFGSKTLSTVATHGFSVDPPYRAVAFSLASAFYRQKSVDLYISSSAIEATGKMGLALKAAAVPQPDYDTVLFWVLRPHSFARTLVKKLDLRPVLSPVVCTMVAFGVAADKFLRRRRPRHTSAKLTLKEAGIDVFGSEMEALWMEKLTEGTRIYAERSAAVLRWHFEIPGDRGSVRVLRCYDDGKLKGYAVVRSDIDPLDGTRRSIIADLIAKQDDPEVVRALWVAAYEQAKAAGSDILEVQGFPSHIREVSYAWRPYRRKYPACPYYYKAADAALHKTLSDPAAWYACPFDGDASLIRSSYSRSTACLGGRVAQSLQSEPAVELAKVQRARVFGSQESPTTPTIPVTKS